MLYKSDKKKWCKMQKVDYMHKRPLTFTRGFAMINMLGVL